MFILFILLGELSSFFFFFFCPLLALSYHRWRQYNLESLSDLSKVTQLVIGRTKARTYPWGLLTALYPIALGWAPRAPILPPQWGRILETSLFAGAVPGGERTGRQLLEKSILTWSPFYKKPWNLFWWAIGHFSDVKIASLFLKKKVQKRKKKVQRRKTVEEVDSTYVKNSHWKF